MIEANEKIAIIGEVGLGDTLIQTVMAENLANAGYDVTLFSDVLQQLVDWFPRKILKPLPSTDDFGAELTAYSRILGSGSPPRHVTSHLKARWIDYERDFKGRLTMVQNLVQVTKKLFDLPFPTTETGIQAPPSLRWRRHRHRVVIHPTSAEHHKNWPVKKFLTLAQRLSQRRFEVVFIMSEAEMAQWAPMIDSRFSTIGFPTLDACAAYIFESGFFIGNDSGGGHLSASLRVPTLSIHGRRGKSRLWRPDWGTVEVVSPAFNLVGSRLRQTCWKYFLTVGRVERAFDKLVRRSCQLEE